MKRLFVLVCLTAFLAFPARDGLEAHSGATGIVKERMEAMKAIGQAMKSLVSMAKGKTRLSEGGVREAARTIGFHAARVDRLFPDTPKSREDHMTEAAPAIWEDTEEFLALARQMADNANALDAAAGNLNRSGLDTFVGTLSNDCKSCHRKFRIKKH